MNPIKGFVGDYSFLSNEYNCQIFIEEDQLTYSNVESALIAQKSDDPGTRRKFSRLNALKARKKSSNIPENYDWEKNKDKIMMDILRIKFKKNNELGKKLIETYPAELINEVSYNDEYYGVRYGNGQNKLGKMLEKIRDEIR